MLHFGVAGLLETAVALADRVKIRRRDQANQLIHFRRQRCHALKRADRHCNDQRRDLAVADHLDRRAQRSASGDAVIDQDHAAPGQVGRRTASAVEPVAARDFAQRAFGALLDCFGRHQPRLEQAKLEHPQPAGTDRAHRVFFVARQAEFAHQHDVELGAQCLRDCKADRHAPARQRQHQYVGPLGISGQALCQQLAGVHAVVETIWSGHEIALAIALAIAL